MLRNVYLTLLCTGLWGVPSCCARQYHFVSLEKNWTEAQSYCRENYTDLAVIDSPEDNEQLLQTAGNPLQYAGWIGLYWDQWSWKWSMGNIRLDNRNGSDFTSWATGQPENYGGKENCGIMESRGLWHDYPCSCSFYFICYQEGSDAAGSYFLIETNKNFTAAQRSCREHHTDLASVRNQSENEEIRLTARGNYVWIGLFMEPWKWSSPSNPAFRNWADGVPDNAAGNEDCASLLMAGSSAGYWNGTGCDQRLPFFCFSEKKRVVMRVGLQLEKGKNPNEPGVRESLLNQMRGLLSRHTVMDRTSLKWKEQKDGLVFHPEKDEGQCDCRGDSAPV
ncbi:macrophage mannose receptor 1-like isoform X2 [Lepisosteus oculatus]|uniref:macrophage mannose receptor 1-like isoform X1 n=1 Tax=Lepisosteus oculatus TaxID=7918 RepID=UPI0035F529BE